MNIYRIYKKNKRANKKNKNMALLYTMQDISELISRANINNGFVDAYKFYKMIAFMGTTLLPSVCLGLGTGAIMLCVDLFVQNIPNLGLQTISNSILLLIGSFSLIMLYMLSCLHTYMNILVPYVVEQMEKRINEFNKKCIQEKNRNKTQG